MRLREIAAFEVEYRLRQKSTWFYAALLLALPLLGMAAMADAPGPLNSPFKTLGMMTLIGMLGMLVTAAIFGDAATRDVATGTHPLFYTMPVTKLDYVGGRFAGAFLVNSGLLLLVPLSFAVGRFLPFDDNPTFLPFAIRGYVEPFVTFVLPNLFFSAAILFATSLLTRNALAGYLAAIALFMTYLIAANEIGGGLDERSIGAVLDPFGLMVLRVLTIYMPQADQDVAYIGLPALLVANRVVWLGAGVLVLAWMFARFRFDMRRTRGASHPDPLTVIPRGVYPEPGADSSLTLGMTGRGARDDKRSFGSRAHLHQLLAITARSLGDIIASRLFQVVLAATVVVIFLIGWDVGQIVFDTSTYHVTHLVTSILRGPAAAAVIILIGVYAGELVWRDRDTRVAEIADTKPTPTWVALGGKFLALLGMIVVLQAVFMVTGMILQAVRGYFVFEPWVYVQVLFGYLAATYILFAAVSFVLHVVVNHRHLGNLAIVLFYFLLAAFPGEFGIKHGLLRFNSDPGFVYSDMNGAGPFVWPLVWFKLYWAAWAMLLFVAGAVFWVRGTESGWRQRLVLARQRFRGGALRAAATAVVLIVTLGGFIFYNTNIVNEYVTDEKQFDRAVAYEKRFGQFENEPQPRIVSLQARIDIHAEDRYVDLKGTYRMVNKTTLPIDSVHVVVSSAVEPRGMSLDRKAALVVDERLPWTYRIYALDRSLLPGDTLHLTFDHRVQPKGFPSSGINTSIAANGAYFDRRWMPAIGYQEMYALDGEGNRIKAGLPPRPRLPLATDAKARQWRSSSKDADQVDLDIVIGTVANQTAVTTGELVREWTEGDRRYFHYKTERPVSMGAPVLSARYAVRADRWKDVSLKVLYHPSHHFNIDRLVRSMKASLDYFTENFGPFQFKELRIAEFPRYANFARAHPQTISFGEGTSFLTRVEEGDIDRPFFVASHEIAHQWWGGQVSSARVEGAGMVSETLAMYSSMMVMERTYGRDMVKQFYDFNMDMYLRGRSPTEMSLLRVRDENYVYYHKGAVAMYQLKERIGEDRVNTALRSFLRKWRDAGPPYATSLDLYHELRAVTPDSVKPMLVDLLETVTTWDVSVTAASAERVAPNQYRVTLEIEGKKLRVDSMGGIRSARISGKGDSLIAYQPSRESEVPMDEQLEIGVYPRPDGKPAELEYLQLHRIRSGKQTITFMVKGQPWRVGVDPRNWLIQRDREFKVVELTPTRRRAKGDSTWRAEFVKPKHVVRVEMEGL